MSCLDWISALTLATAHDVLCVQQQPCSAATFRLCRFLCEECFPLSTQRRSSWISMIAFIILGEQFSVLNVSLKSFTSNIIWCVMTFLRNVDDFVPVNSLKKCVDEYTHFIEHLLDALHPFGPEQLDLVVGFHFSVLIDSFYLFIAHLHSLEKPFEGGAKHLRNYLDLSEPDSFAVSLGELLHPPEPFLPEDGPPLVLEEDPYQL